MELLKSPWYAGTILVQGEKRSRWEMFLTSLKVSADVYELSQAQWKDLSQDKESEGIMALATLPPREDVMNTIKKVAGHMVWLYRVANPNNLGAVLRTAHWFGIDTIVLSEGSVDFTHPKVIRASMGSLFHLSVIGDVDFYEILPAVKECWQVVGCTVRSGVAPHPCARKTILMMGSESHGLPEDLVRMVDERWHIPGMGTAESLSLPQAAAILMYECVKKES